MKNPHIEPRVRKLGEPVAGADGELLVFDKGALPTEALRPFARAMGREGV